MPEDLVFMMGKYEARIPGDRLYTENHLWLQPADTAFRVGLTAWSVRLLQDVYFLDWDIDADASVRHKQEIGQIESSKAVSALYAPADGRLLSFNEQLLDDPSAINTDGYGDGWLYLFETDANLLSPAEYVAHLEANWEKTQRLIKGQLN
ncbi:Glycine cleavage system H protein [Maioricimonas rarisocia]|uniref:Glycine cleavage system H protein n=1 Tax=Maioricimonas rarisocia TaxID=2528026 RepID=A0A517Z4B2_9PLAN|nr:glycine cleavage system protein H [Maioricimonas rarisocia]QDU37309.1 Glycine cleavage system H protein [Maioricimonas rarisocia]